MQTFPFEHSDVQHHRWNIFSIFASIKIL